MNLMYIAMCLYGTPLTHIFKYLVRSLYSMSTASLICWNSKKWGLLTALRQISSINFWATQITHWHILHLIRYECMCLFAYHRWYNIDISVNAGSCRKWRIWLDGHGFFLLSTGRYINTAWLADDARQHCHFHLKTIIR